MMEFTLSRAVALICGVILLGAIIAPFTDVMDKNEESRYQTQCDNISGMLDAFGESGAEDMAISMNTVLPSEGSSLELNGHLVKMTIGDREWRSVLKCEIVSDKIYGNGDIVRFVKDGNLIKASCESDRDLLQSPDELLHLALRVIQIDGRPGAAVYRS